MRAVVHTKQTIDSGVLGSLDPLCGLYFYTLEAGDLAWQGQIRRCASSGWYLVQLFDWLVGAPSQMRLVRVEQIATWPLFDDEDQWHEAMQRIIRHLQLAAVGK